MTIVHDRDHWVILDDNGKFHGSADTYGEALRDIEEEENHE